MQIAKKFSIFALAGLATPTAAQVTENGSATDPIVVTGARQSNSDEVRSGVDAIAPSTGPAEPLARFMDPVCLGFAGLGERQEEIIRKVIELRAQNAGVRLADHKCRTDALVVIVDDLAGFAQNLKRSRPNLMPASEYRRFEISIEEGDPVFVSNTHEVRTALGRPAPHSATIPGLTLPMSVSTNVNTDGRARRVGLEQSAALLNSIVVFDAGKLSGFSLVQLADYASMRLFVATNEPMNWHGGMSSILKLFSDDPADVEDTMTAFDESYLLAVYELPLNAAPSRLKPKVLDIYLKKSEQ